MRIGNWNIQRLKEIKKIDNIQFEIDSRDFDILVLTEYDERIKPIGFKYQIATDDLMGVNTDKYEETERRVKIFSKFPIINQISTFNKFTSCCAELKTDRGNLVVYGTIIGVYGNRDQNFKDDLPKQIADFKKITLENNICIIGDYNTTFCDNYYFTKFGRQELNKVFQENKIQNLTSGISENIDHISISEKFIDNSKITLNTWNLDKTLSDHIGVSVEMT